MHKLTDAFDAVIRAINSCETEQQLRNALKFRNIFIVDSESEEWHTRNWFAIMFLLRGIWATQLRARNVCVAEMRGGSHSTSPRAVDPTLSVLRSSMTREIVPLHREVAARAHQKTSFWAERQKARINRNFERPADGHVKQNALDPARAAPIGVMWSQCFPP